MPLNRTLVVRTPASVSLRAYTRGALASGEVPQYKPPHISQQSPQRLMGKSARPTTGEAGSPRSL
jgi:hypothetical protein